MKCYMVPHQSPIGMSICMLRRIIQFIRNHCSLFKARDLAKATSAENIIGGAEAILKCADWSATSDFKSILGGSKTVGPRSGKKNQGEETNRGVQNAIRFYDKMVQAQLVHLLSCARVSFPKGLLDSSSKMIKLMEKARKHPC